VSAAPPPVTKCTSQAHTIMKTDRVVVITGAAGGMGSLLVRRFLTNDDTVIATDTTDEGLKSAETRKPETPSFIPSPATSRTRETARKSRISPFHRGRVDVLINVAAYFLIQSYDEMTAADFRRARDLRPMTSAPIIANTGFDKAKGNAVIAAGHANLVAFGVPYIANPDLVQRLRVDAPLNKSDPSTLYGSGPAGFTDYPRLSA